MVQGCLNLYDPCNEHLHHRATRQSDSGSDFDHPVLRTPRARVAEGSIGWARSDGNYRIYDAQAYERLMFVRSAQVAGFTLGDITELVALKDDQAAPCDEVQGLISSRLDEVVEQIEHLRNIERVLGRWLRACRCARRSGKCAVLVGLDSSKQKKSTKV